MRGARRYHRDLRRAKVEIVLSPQAERVGKLIVADIGIPPRSARIRLSLRARRFRAAVPPAQAGLEQGRLRPRSGDRRSTRKNRRGGHGRTRRAAHGRGTGHRGCSDASRLAPELMTESLDDFSLERKTVMAIGPGWARTEATGRRRAERSNGSDGHRRGWLELDRRHGFSRPRPRRPSSRRIPAKWRA